MKVRFATRSAIAAVVLIATMISGPAQACQLVCQATATSYDGNLGGLTGADAKCAAEYPNFKFARSVSLLSNLAGGDTAIRMLFGGGGVYSYARVASAAGYSNCSNWGSNASATGPAAAYTYLSGPTAGEGRYSADAAGANCANLYPLICCNM